jgi:hypothetical protein
LYSKKAIKSTSQRIQDPLQQKDKNQTKLGSGNGKLPA